LIIKNKLKIITLYAFIIAKELDFKKKLDKKKRERQYDL